MANQNHQFILNKGQFRGQFIQATELIRSMAESHEQGPLENLVLGQAYLAVLIMAAHLKDQGRIQLDINCDGPLGGLSVEADTTGSVRGYLKNNPIPSTGNLSSLNDLSPLFGSGTMRVTRLEEKKETPYSSTITLKEGNLSKDLAYYFMESEQIPSFVNLSIQFDRQGNITSAGALFLQVMPGVSDEELSLFENEVLSLPPLGESLEPGVSPQKYLNEALKDFNPQILSKTDLQFYCPCNKKRIGNFLKQLPEKDKKDILSGKFPMEMKCHNCNSQYFFTKDDLLELYSEK